MKDRSLSAEEAALWARVVASVEPLDPRPAPTNLISPVFSSEVERPRSTPKSDPHFSTSLEPNRIKSRTHANTLDGSWDRRLSRGLVQPDLAVDLHGHNLDSAYRTLDAGLAQAIQRGARVLLLVTGKPRDRSTGRGTIRAAVGDWLAASRHADGIAAVRGAHPRHGGQGALYIVLRRPRLATP